MKRILAFITLTSILFSIMTGNIVFSASGTYAFQTSFEGEWKTADWTDFKPLQEGVIYYGTNTDSRYVTSGSQSLYFLDNATDSYPALMTPLTACQSGEYTLSFDTRVLSGELRAEVRLFTDNSDKFSHKKRSYITIPANTKFETHSIDFIVDSSIKYISVLFISSTKDDITGEGYFDNVKVVRTGDYFFDAIQNKMTNASAGTEIVIKNGSYKDVNLNFTTSGTDAKPVILRAETPGKVIFTGDSSLKISGSYLVVEGIRYEEITNLTPIVLSGNNCTIRDCALYKFGATSDTIDTVRHWLNLSGSNCLIENCFFSTNPSVAKGQMISGDARDTNVRNTIKNCYFGDIAYQTENSYEAIRLGSSVYSFNNCKSKIQGCFFYQCNGEGETISVKSCENIVRYNTLYDNHGGIVLRHGNRNQVYGNLFVGGDSDKNYRETGIRVIGEDHKIHDNYFYNLPVKSPVLLLANGCSYDGIQNSWYYPVRNAEIYNNTIIGGDRTLTIGNYVENKENLSKNTVMAPQGKIYNNAIVSYSGTNPLMQNGDPDAGKADTAYNQIEFTNNYFYGKALGYVKNGVNTVPNGISNEYFRLVQNGKYFKPENGTGADISIVKKAPTSPFDIISDWVKEVYYDTGKVTFEVAVDDPFNDKSAHINNIIPFDVSVTGDSKEDSVKLYENNTLVKGNSKTVSCNPTMKVVATPLANKEVTWFVNGKMLNESNIDTLGVITDSVHSNELIINNVTENFNIEVEFNYISTIPDEISGTFSKVKGTANKENPLIVKTSKGEEKITGKYALIAKKIFVTPLIKVKEWGVKVSANGAEFIKMPSDISLTTNGTFGIVLFNLEDGKTYKVKPYAIYLDANNNEKSVEGTVENITE